MKENFKKIFDQMEKVETLTFGELHRASIDKELQTLEPEELYQNYEKLNPGEQKMKDFVKKEYLKVL